VSAFPEGESLFKWIGTISGPKGTVSSSDKCHVVIKGCGLCIIQNINLAEEHFVIDSACCKKRIAI
jgi:hypothetical protein